MRRAAQERLQRETGSRLKGLQNEIKRTRDDDRISVNHTLTRLPKSVVVHVVDIKDAEVQRRKNVMARVENLEDPIGDALGAEIRMFKLYRKRLRRGQEQNGQ